MSQLKNIMSIQQGGLPSRYILADNISITTNQYIDTGIAAIPRYTESEFKINWVGSSTNNRGLFGVRGAAVADDKAYNVFLTVSGSGPRWDNTGGPMSGSSWSIGETHIVKLTHSGSYGQAVVDGNVVVTGSTAMSTDSYNSIYINTFYTVSTSAVINGATVKWYYVKIWGDGVTLSADMVPVYDTVGQEAGMYDYVRNIFIGGGNSGGNAIIAYDSNGNVITG